MLESAPAPCTPPELPGPREGGHMVPAACKPSGPMALLADSLFIVVTTLAHGHHSHHAGPDFLERVQNTVKVMGASRSRGGVGLLSSKPTVKVRQTVQPVSSCDFHQNIPNVSQK